MYIICFSLFITEDKTGFLVEFVNGMIRDVTPTTDDPNLATLKEELVNILDSYPFGKQLGFQDSSCANLPAYSILLHECKHVRCKCSVEKQ